MKLLIILAWIMAGFMHYKAVQKMAKLELKDSLSAAKELLGWSLVHETPEGRAGGYIVETEAYNEDDPASHAYGGRRIRNQAMFERAGTIYVYFTYGMHFCMNIVTGQIGRGEAILIRALEPSEGIELMMKRRGVSDIKQLTNGPAKLVQALGIGSQHSGSHIDNGTVKIRPGFKPNQVVQTTRIGISKATDKPWRFYVADNKFVSKP